MKTLKHPACYQFSLESQIAFWPSIKSTHILKNLFKQIIAENFHLYALVFTDASKVGQEGGCAVFISSLDIRQAWKLPGKLSIYTMELSALRLALDLIKERNIGKGLACSDSKSTVQTLEHMSFRNTYNYIELDIKEKLHDLYKQDQDIKIMWIPRYQGIFSNEVADALANQGGILDTMIERLTLVFDCFPAMSRMVVGTKLP